MKIQCPSILWLSITSTLLLLMACNTHPPFDQEKETKVILQLLENERTYHFDKKAEEFANTLSPNHISVNRGVISHPTLDENTTRFEGYFNAVEFEKWDNISPPVIRFSHDGSMAYAIVNKEVVIRYPDEEDKIQKDTTEFAWVTIYTKYGGKWKIDCVASTNKPTSTDDG